MSDVGYLQFALGFSPTVPALMMSSWAHEKWTYKLDIFHNLVRGGQKEHMIDNNQKNYSIKKSEKLMARTLDTYAERGKVKRMQLGCVWVSQVTFKKSTPRSMSHEQVDAKAHDSHVATDKLLNCSLKIDKVTP